MENFSVIYINLKINSIINMRKFLYLCVCVFLLGVCSCSDDDDNLKAPDITVSFGSAELGMEENASADLVVNLSRGASVAQSVTVEMEESADIFASDVVTVPAMTDRRVVVAIPAGETTGTIRVTRAKGKRPEGQVKFRISSLSVTEGFKIGDQKELSLSFQAIVSTGNTMILQGKTTESNYTNMVYVDLSSSQQTQVNRKSWNLGFYCGDAFTVVLNSSYATVAASSGKRVFSEVTIADAESAPNLAAGAMSEEFSSAWVDAVNGDLTKTVFGTIAANDADNEVFYVLSEDNKVADRKEWYKVKVTRKGDGYSVQFGKVGEVASQTVEIPKNAAYNFIGLSLESGKTVEAQPEGKRWDILWAYGAAESVMSSGAVTSFSQDVVYSNRMGGVETALVMVDGSTTYDSFSKSDLSKAEFQTVANVIGTTWRTPAMPGVTNPGVKTDRFWVVKDPYGNYYKLRFTKFGTGDDGTERGKPEIQYSLLK